MTQSIASALFLVHPATHPYELPSEGWREVGLPHQWSLEGLETEVGWYHLRLPAHSGRRFARVLGDYITEAWVAGTHLGRHEGYFEPWLLELPKEAQQLFLRVAAPLEPLDLWPNFKRQIKGVFGHHDCRPGGSSPRGQERSTGGLWGGVAILGTGPTAILHLSYRAVRVPGGWRLVVALTMDSTFSVRLPLRLTLTPANFQGDAFETRPTLEQPAGRRNHTLVWDLPEVQQWEVWERGFPHVYRLRAELEGHALEVPCGFRSVEEADNWLLLNGKRLFLRGTNVIPTQWLANYGPEAAGRDVALIREANLNAVRVHAHLTHPAFYEACDREGILVWQDFPLQWGYEESESLAQEVLRQAGAMVEHYGSHPSIYLWCAHNEPTHNRHTLAPLLAAELRAADPTRLIKEASDFREHPYPGWYWGHYRDFLALPGAPLPSEFGAQALPRAELLRQVLGEAAWPPEWEHWQYHNFQPDQTFSVAGVKMGQNLEEFVEHSQTYQARLLDFAIHAYRRAKGTVAGYFQFMFVEPWEGITWAVLDVERVPKRGFNALKEASAPVLISLVPFHERLPMGINPLMEVWLISDLDRPCTLRYRVFLDGPENLVILEGEASLKAQEVRRVFHFGEAWELPSEKKAGLAELGLRLATLPAGKYRLVGEAWEGERLWSRQALELEYLAAP
jgi:beta-mannosidase